MRRILRWFLIVVVSSSLWIDAAQAGWHHRRAWHPVPVGCGSMIPADHFVVEVTERVCCLPAVWAAADGAIVEDRAVVGWESVGWESVACPAADCCDPVDCCVAGGEPAVWDGHLEQAIAGGEQEFVSSEVLSEGFVSQEHESGELLLTETVPLGEVTESVVGEVFGEIVTEPLAVPFESSPTVMDDAVEPAVMDRPEAFPPAEAESSVLVPEGLPQQAAESEPIGPEPVVHDPLQMESPDAVEETPAVEAGPPPADTPTVEPEPVNIFEAEEGQEAAVEPVRRWIHACGDRSLVARLVGLSGPATCLLEIGSRRIAVPLDRLSDHDRSYVDRAVERLAAARGAAQAVDTAGL